MRHGVAAQGKGVSGRGQRLATAHGGASAANSVIGVRLERPTRTAAPVLRQE
jgi:hypothetical protein